MITGSSASSDLLTAVRPKSPYPGLRPFEVEEWSIFFGREQMVDEVVGRLADHHLVMIHGSSGSGKSSLVRAGVLPKLARQHLRAGAPWQTCSIRPSGGPLWNLAKEFARLEGRGDDVERVGQILGQFNRRGATLSDIAGSLENLKARRLCILVDQFEELFRFEKETSREEAELFVDLLVRGREQAPATGGDTGAPGDQSAAVHVVATMRSEFLGECARFNGLAEAVNRTQYLVPRMDRDGLMRAIRRPALLYGGEVSLDLAERLIADVGGREDELPLIQHGLMYMWNTAAAATPPGSKIVLDAGLLEAAGGLPRLLSGHADAIVDEAAPDPERRYAVRAAVPGADRAERRRPCGAAAAGVSRSCCRDADRRRQAARHHRRAAPRWRFVSHALFAATDHGQYADRHQPRSADPLLGPPGRTARRLAETRVRRRPDLAITRGRSQGFQDQQASRSFAGNDGRAMAVVAATATQQRLGEPLRRKFPAGQRPDRRQPPQRQAQTPAAGGIRRRPACSSAAPEQPTRS